MAGQINRLGPDWLDKHIANKKNATVYKVEYGTAEFVPAKTVVERLNTLADVIKVIRKEHPEWTVGDQRRHILTTVPNMKDFYRTHKTFFLTITRPDLSMEQAEEMYRLCYYRQLSEEGKMSAEEAEDIAKAFVTGNHLRPLTPEQQLEHQKTGKVPDDAFDRSKMGYLMNRFKLTMKDSDTGETVTPGDSSLNEDGMAGLPIIPEPLPKNPPVKPSTKSLRNKQKQEARRQKSK